MANIKLKRLNDYAVRPLQGSKQAAGVDLYAAIPDIIDIPAHSTVMISTGWAIEIPENTFAAILPRSGLATKRGLRPANTPGVCDSDYRGEYMVALHNDTDTIQTVQPGERIAQMIILPYLPIDEMIEVDELSETERGDHGFGSTGTM